MIYSFGQDEGTTTPSLPPIKNSDSRHIASDFEQNDVLKGIHFRTISIEIYYSFILKYFLSYLILSGITFRNG